MGTPPIDTTSPNTSCENDKAQLCGLGFLDGVPGENRTRISHLGGARTIRCTTGTENLLFELFLDQFECGFKFIESYLEIIHGLRVGLLHGKLLFA